MTLRRRPVRERPGLIPRLPLTHQRPDCGAPLLETREVPISRMVSVHPCVKPGYILRQPLLRFAPSHPMALALLHRILLQRSAAALHHFRSSALSRQIPQLHDAPSSPSQRVDLYLRRIEKLSWSKDKPHSAVLERRRGDHLRCRRSPRQNRSRSSSFFRATIYIVRSPGKLENEIDKSSGWNLLRSEEVI